MDQSSALSPGKLTAKLAPERIPFKDSSFVDPAKTPPPQPRALHALELALNVRDQAGHVYVSGAPHMGRTYFVVELLTPKAQKLETPPDLVYLHNFDDQDRPRLVELPHGEGRELKTALAAALADVKKDITERFETEHYLNKRGELEEAFRKNREGIVGDMESTAAGEGFRLEMDDSGQMALYPLLDGKPVSEEDFDNLPPTERRRIKSRGDALRAVLGRSLRTLAKEESGLKERERDLWREIARQAAGDRLKPLIERFAVKPKNKRLAAFFESLENDVVDNAYEFAPRDAKDRPAPLLDGPHPPPDPFFPRGEVNLFVDNADQKGAPIIVEDHPTFHNLLGVAERESEMGALVTDFTLIKAGSLHKANGGFLIINIEDLMQNLSAWEGLLRALRSGKGKIEEPAENADASRTRAIEPEALKLDLKVLLIGGDDAYEALLSDDRFAKLFKFKAHLQDSVPRDPKRIEDYIPRLAGVIQKAQLRPFDRSALAGLVDYSSRLAEDQKKLSLKFPKLREIMIEADALAALEKKSVVDAALLAKAVKMKEYRSNLYEEEFLEDYDRELIKAAVDGKAVGRVNGLSVTWYGDHEFGLPHQIACTVGVGRDGVLDLERAADLGGPIHTKAMYILQSWLLGKFAVDKPIVLTGSLGFEQSYAGVEGDSASGAELAALLSAVAQAPIDLSFAFTGAVSQSGAIMAVGGVTRKIEGFYEVCRRRGLTGRQGVIMPKDNLDHLLLSDAVVDAAARGEFHIYAVSTIEEALKLLTGMDPGERDASGAFPEGTLYRLVDERLTRLAQAAREWFRPV